MRPLNQISRIHEDSLHNKAASGLSGPFPYNLVVGLFSLVSHAGNYSSLDDNLPSGSGGWLAQSQSQMIVC